MENPLPRSRIGSLMCFHWGFFTFYELESLRLLSRRLIRFGKREARKGNCGRQNAACCPSSIPTVLEAFWGELPPGKGGNVSQNAFSDPDSYLERCIWPNTEKGGGVHPPRPLTILPAHSPPHPQELRARRCLTTVDCVKYIVNMK